MANIRSKECKAAMVIQKSRNLSLTMTLAAEPLSICAGGETGSWPVWASLLMMPSCPQSMGCYRKQLFPSEKLSESTILTLLVLVAVLCHVHSFLIGSFFFSFFLFSFWALCHHLFKKVSSSASRVALVSHFTSLVFICRVNTFN